MKKDIHPKYFNKAKIKCACGQVFEVGSTLEEFQLEICSNCHPVYTGKEKIIDTAGRVEKFKQKVAKQQTIAKSAPKKKERTKKQDVAKTEKTAPKASPKPKASSLSKKVEEK